MENNTKQNFKINYRIHTDAIKEHLIVPELPKQYQSFTYATEADVLNVAMFGMTAKQWREANPTLDGNIRDHATLQQLIILSNLESLNVEISSDDFSFRRWKAGQEDMKWASIIDSEFGIFGKTFIRAYAPEFEERSSELSRTAINVYRECSEYIHGNYSKLNCLPGQNELIRNCCQNISLVFKVLHI